jgi:hypothetical protein
MPLAADKSISGGGCTTLTPALSREREREPMQVASPAISGCGGTTLTPTLSREREREPRHHRPLAGDGYSCPLSLRERARVRVVSIGSQN